MEFKKKNENNQSLESQGYKNYIYIYIYFASKVEENQENNKVKKKTKDMVASSRVHVQ